MVIDVLYDNPFSNVEDLYSVNITFYKGTKKCMFYCYMLFRS